VSCEKLLLLAVKTISLQSRSVQIVKKTRNA